MSQLQHIHGFFDLQVNGYKGVDFSSDELTEASFAFACRELQKTGTVGFLPTIISSEIHVYKKNLSIISKLRQYKEFNQIIAGVHLEGPFISGEDGYRGIHPLQNIRMPDEEFLKQLISWSQNSIRMITLAAELENSAKLCKCAISRGIVVSLGHQNANEKQIDSLATKGARALTHLGNGLPHLVHRHLNPLWTGMANELLAAMIIADGFHLPIPVIKSIIKAKGVKNTILVSDLSPLGGLKPGLYRIWGSDVTLSNNGFLFNPASGYLAASSFSLLDCANFLLGTGFVSLKDLSLMAFYNPLRLLGIHPSAYSRNVNVKLKGNKLHVAH